MNTARDNWIGLLTDAVETATGVDQATAAKYAAVILSHLSHEFGGHRVYVPTIATKPLPLDKILNLLGAGVSTAEVARRFGVTPRTIGNYVPGGLKALRGARCKAQL